MINCNVFLVDNLGGAVEISKITTTDKWDTYWAEVAADQSTLPAIRWRADMLEALLKKNCANLANPCIIEFGSGPGMLLRKLAPGFPHGKLIGMEQAASAIAYARSQASEGAAIEYVEADLMSVACMEKIDLKGDIGVCSEVLEHLEKPERFLQSCVKMLKPDGALLVTVPGGPQTAFTRYFGHFRHYTPNDLRVCLEPFFEEVECWSAGFPFFNIYQMCCYLHGEKLVQNHSTKDNVLIRLGTAVFNLLFKFNLDKFPLGWQTMGIAKRPRQIA